MARYIDADKLRQKIYDYKISELLTEIVLEEIDEQPTADVEEVRHGKWIEEKHSEDVYCSSCLKIPFFQKYCGSCGAKMDGKTE